MIEQETLAQAIRQVGDKAHPWRGFLLVAERRRRLTKNGDPYLTLRLADVSGTVDAVLFSDNPAFEKAADPATAYVAVRGNLERSPKYGLQLTIADIRPVREDDRELGFDEGLLTPSTPYDVDALWDELSELAGEVAHEKLRETVQALLKENEEAARSWPAAQRVHQAYRGGWLEHTLFVARDAKYYARKYPELDGDLLLVGAILHDVGKLKELDGEPTCEFTDEGRLVGHVVIGAWMAREAAAKTGLDERTILLLEHLILAHHGEREYGAAVLPKTREAVVLYHIDNIDAKLGIFRRRVEEDPAGGEWTGRAWEFGNQQLWRGDAD
ncbi:MAG TPA: HD domain-containing protein [bacterium]|nr:HD domain-containing protein [bacterium]